MGVADVNYDFDPEEELERKTAEALEEIENQHRRGQISDYTYRMMLWAVDKTTRGLVDENVALAIDQEVSMLPSVERVTQVFAAGDTIYLLTYVYGEDWFATRTLKAGKASGKKIKGEGVDPVHDAYQKFVALKKKLTNMGYKEI